MSIDAMEELQDAIEDARYVNAITTQDDGPQPVVTWDKPTEEELTSWKETVKHKPRDEGSPEPFGIDWTLASGIGLFLFSSYLKDKCAEYLRINFIEEIQRWHKLTGRYRVYKARRIIYSYLKSPKNVVDDGSSTVRKIEIEEYDLDRVYSKLDMDKEAFKTLCDENIDPSNSKCVIGINGKVRDNLLAIQSRVDHLERTGSGLFAAERKSSRSLGLGDSDVPNGDLEEAEVQKLRDTMLDKGPKFLPDDFFDKVDAVVVESLRRDYWEGFLESEEYSKLLEFLWYQDRQIVPEDFYTMRVLGRGGFGLVTACKKGTSGKLYAMKVMNKRRIKMKKSSSLALNERKVLAVVDSPFVVNLKYSFHSKDDVFLILDLMTGGDLGFHLHQKGRFPIRESLYYASRIMLGLQALHDKKYVYRDLKPENCLLAVDGRVKITDLGLATKITPTLQGAAGTRGYWAPEMLRKDSRGKRMPYDHSVDWFSFGCCVAEFISGTNPFRSEKALKFGMDNGQESKSKALDYATLEMEPDFDLNKFDEASADLCRQLLNKNEKERLGYNGCEEIMTHAWFREVDWEMIILDRKRPPFVPAKDVNAASQSEIGNFAEDQKYQETVIDEKDDVVYENWDWTNPRAFAAEVIECLIYERVTGEPLVPVDQHPNCCCTIL